MKTEEDVAGASVADVSGARGRGGAATELLRGLRVCLSGGLALIDMVRPAQASNEVMIPVADVLDAEQIGILATLCFWYWMVWTTLKTLSPFLVGVYFGMKLNAWLSKKETKSVTMQTDVDEIDEILKLTVESLREELRAHDLCRTGTKAELAMRVQRARHRERGERGSPTRGHSG